MHVEDTVATSNHFVAEHWELLVIVASMHSEG